MSKPTIALAYCIDNLAIAEQIARELSPSGYQFEHIYCKKNPGEAALADQLRDFDGEILLLVSDNFLKSVHCMNRALQLIQQKGSSILPVVVNGLAKNEDTDQYEEIPTRFERIGDIIPYINYWQGQYLDLRSQKRKIENDDDYDKDALSDHLRVLRQVSSEASEFLRVLRNMAYVSIEQFQDKQYEAFFRFLEDEEAWQESKGKIATMESSHPGVNSPVSGENTQSSAGDIMVESPIEIDLGGSPEDHFEAETNTGEQGADESIDIAIPESPNPADQVEPGAPTPQVNIVATTPEEDDIKPTDDQATTPELDHPSPSSAETGNAWDEDHPAEFDEEDEEESEDMEEESEEVELISPPTGLKEAPLPDFDYDDYDYDEEKLDAPWSDETGHDETQADLIQQGELAEAAGDFTKARMAYEKAVELDNSSNDILYKLGVFLMNYFPEEAGEAAGYFKKAIKRNQGNDDATYRYALLLNDVMDKPKKARKYFLETLKRNASHPFAHYDLALLYFSEEKFDLAKDAYLKAIAINADFHTPENDEVFGIADTSVADPAPVEHLENIPPSSQGASEPAISERSTIEALKQNVQRLEELLQAKVDQAEENRFPKPNGKTVFITGATSGIGRATAIQFAQGGYRLILNGRREDRLEALQKELEANYQSEILLLPFDVTDAATVEMAISNLPAEWQAIDILVNNAGKAKGLAPIQEGQLAHWEEMIDTNLKGLLYITRAVSPGMVARRKGHIINIGSIAGKEAYANGNVYCATKSGVDALTQAMRLDLHKHNIRVSHIAPGAVEETEFALVRFDGDAEKAKIYNDFKPLTSGDVAQVIYFMATQPPHVTIQDVVLMGTQQASATVIDRSGRD
ncbi:MAG: SDR family NAD(P)-dependent oxidoreductase [Lewinellaceae bacterium]|nr:SDR family NAD(P)-dependent oxidoreductase [Lewinellaceae bacterium]